MTPRRGALVLTLLSLVAAPEAAAQLGRPDAQRCYLRSRYWPTKGWRQSNPYAQGIDGAALERSLAAVGKRVPSLFGVVVIRNGYLVVERYFRGYGPRDAFEVASVTKSVLSAAAGIALRDGAIRGLDEPVLQLVPELAPADTGNAARKVTIRHLLTMTSGIAWPASIGSSHGLRMASAPGSQFEFADGDAHLLSVAIGRATGTESLKFAADRLFTPLGIARDAWWWAVDGHGHAAGGAGLRLRAGDLAKIGFLYLKDGCWEGREILPAGWVDSSTAPQITRPDDGGTAYGFLWWVTTLAGRPAYYATGYGGQYLVVIPALDLIIVVTGDLSSTLAASSRHFELIRDVIVPAIKR